LNLTIQPLSPFSLDLSARRFMDGDPQIRRYENGVFWQVIRANDKLLLATVHALGTVDEPRLSLKLEPGSGLSGDDIKKAKEIICSILNLDIDLKRFYSAVKDDEVMFMLTQQLYGLQSPATATVFEVLVDTITEQQISLKAAFALQRKLTRAFGDILKIDDKVYYAYPLPERLAVATVNQLMAYGLSTRKAEYIHDLSERIVEGLDLERLKSYEADDKIIEELKKIRGIGIWTATYALIRGMHRMDVMPADDLGLRMAISHYYCQDLKISSAKAREIGKLWRDWKGLACYYLLVAYRQGI